MKYSFRSIFLLASIVLASTSLKAQVGEHRTDLSIGVTGGYTMNTMDFVPRIKQSQKGGPMFGFSSRYICEKYFTTICGVALELQYNNLGWKEVIEDGSGNTYKRDWHFLQMPVMMQMGWGRERKGFKFVFEAGPQFGLYLSGKEHRGGGVWDTSARPNGVVYQYGKDPDNQFDYGIAAGLGLEFSNPHAGHFLLQGRYYYGLGDMYDNSKHGDFGRSANQTITVKLTYLFDIIRTKNDQIK